MRYWTLAEMVAKVEADLGIEDEDFVAPAELVTYFNEGIDQAEAEIHTLYEGYFLSRDTMSLVSGTEAYDFPATIYGMKFVKIMYRNGGEVYEIRPVPEHQAVDIYETNQAAGLTGGPYEYLIDNSTAGDPQIIITPTPNESGAYVKRWFLRNANRLSADADVCDIPEFVSFVLQFAKMRCYEKEGHPLLAKAINDLEHPETGERKRMRDTLAQKQANANNLVPGDFSLYKDMN